MTDDPVVLLDDDVLAESLDAGIRRSLSAYRKGQKDKYGKQLHDLIVTDCLGACGEAAVRTYLGIDALLTVDAPRHAPDLPGRFPGALGIQVKTRSEDHRDLMIHLDHVDPPAPTFAFVLVTGRIGEPLTIRGWITTPEIRSMGFVKFHWGTRYVVPQSRLHSIATARSLTGAEVAP
jgi:hypothetical protein